MNRRFESRWWRSPCLLASMALGLAGIFFSARIDLPLLEPEEARYAEIPRQMLACDRLLVPIRDGQDYLDKPPLLYWMVMASYQLFGIHDWSARLPTVLAAWLTVGVVLAWGWRISNPMVGIAAAAVLTLTGDFVYRAPMLTMNGPLALFIAAALVSGHFALAGDVIRWRWWLASALMCGLGILMKGPVAAALIVAPLLAWPWLVRGLHRPAWWTWLAWGSVALTVAGPWFVAVALRQPDFISYFFWKHHVERFATPFDHAGPVWAYVPQLVVGFMPWTVAVAIFAWRWRSERVHDGGVLVMPLLAGIWGFALFSLAGSKRPVYLVAVEPLLAMAAGAFFWRARANVRPTLWLGLGLSTALAIGGGLIFWLPAYSQRFSVAAVARLVNDADLPVFCYGHGWDSIGFYLQNDEVKTFLGADRGNVTRELAAHARSIVFVSTKRDGNDFIDQLPVGYSFRVLGSNRQVRVGIVETVEFSHSGESRDEIVKPLRGP